MLKRGSSRESASLQCQYSLSCVGLSDLTSRTLALGTVVRAGRREAMDTGKLLQLEKAAGDVMSPPYAVTEERRREAEAIFMELKKSKLPYETCKFILENSECDYVLFQAGSAVREAVIREWEILRVEEKDSLRGYILHYITTKPNLAVYVRGQLLHTVAVMVKRATLESDRRKLFDSVFTTVSQLLTLDSKMRQLGCSFLSALLSEYANSSGASNVGLPIEFHVRCKKTIESEELLRILLFAVQVLQQYVTVDLSSLGTEDLSLLDGFLELTSKVLNWDFQLSKFSPVPLNISDVVTVPLRPPRSYTPTFTDPSFLSLLFTLLGKLCQREDLLHHLVQGLTQLASLTKPVLVGHQEQQRFLANFVSGIFTYISSRPDMTRQEVYGVSCILRRLATNFPVRLFSSLPDSQFPLLVASITQLTCLSAHRSVLEDELGDDCLAYQESLEHYLEVFVSFLEDPAALPGDLLTQPAVEVFNAFIRSKLTVPRGWRSREREEGEIIEIEEDDCEAFSDQLRSIGTISRSIPHHSLPLLTQLVGQCTGSCLEVLSMLEQNPQSLYSQQNTLDSTYEDLHWLVLIAGFTLCDIVKGEDVLIPALLMKYSVELQGKVECVAPLDVAALVWREGVEQVDLSAAKLDPIVALFLSVCRLCMVEKMFTSRGLIDVVSPQLSTTVVWCLSQIAHPYLHLSEDSYDQVSLPLLSVFGRDSSCSRWLCVFLLEKVALNLSLWSGEEKLSLTTIHLLGSLVRSTERASVVIQCDVLWSLMRRFSSGQPPISSLPPAVQRELICGLLRCGVGERRQQYLTELLQPLQHRFTSLVQRPDFRVSCHEVATQQELLSVLEALCGLAHNARPALIQEFFSFLLPLLRGSVQLLELYCDVSEVIRVILELFTLMAENYIVFLSEDQTLQLYDVCLSVIQSYARSATGKYSTMAMEEEQQCDDLLLFMKMMTHLTIKDYVDFGAKDDVSVKPVDVVITGLNIILPLMTEDILKFPNLCRQFYTLVNYMCESFPERLATLPEQLFLACMQLLERGVADYGVEICTLSLESIEGVASSQARAESQSLGGVASSQESLQSSQTLTQILEHFLKVIFDLMLSSSFDMDIIHATSGAVYAIICSHEESYQSLASSLIASQTEPQHQARLMEAFSRLTPSSLPLDYKRTSKLTFRKNLEQFLPFVKGFLCYK